MATSASQNQVTIRTQAQHLPPHEATSAGPVPWHRYLLFLVLALGGCAADLWTKSWIFSWPELQPQGAAYWLWEGHAGFQLSLNRGALFGMGQGMVWLFALMSLVAGMAIPLWLFWGRAGHDRLLTAALGCVMGGVLGNLYDRLGLASFPESPRWEGAQFAVRDWILWQWNDRWTWPNFNIADSLLVCGVALALFHVFRQPAAVELDRDADK